MRGGEATDLRESNRNYHFHILDTSKTVRSNDSVPTNEAIVAIGNTDEFLVIGGQIQIANNRNTKFLRSINKYKALIITVNRMSEEVRK